VYGTRDRDPARHSYKPKDLQAVQHYEDKANEAMMVLEANVEVLLSLQGFYERLVKRKDFPKPLRDSCEEGLLNFVAQLQDRIYDSKMHISRTKLLVRITADRKSLVGLLTVYTVLVH